MTTTQPLFKDRKQAGKLLGKKLEKYRSSHPLLLAIPRGGVPVAFEIAKMLHAPLDTLVVRKIGAPLSPEFGVGAIAPGDVLVLDTIGIQSLGLLRKDLDPIVEKQLQEMDRRMVHYQSGMYSKNIATNTIIIVDDGLATGSTARAAIESAKITYKSKHIVFAVPLCSLETVDKIKDLVDDFICVREIEKLLAIGYWYRQFDQTTDEEVIGLLEKAKELFKNF